MRVTLYGITKRLQGMLGNPCFECDHADIITDERLNESIIVTEDDNRLNVEWTNRADNRHDERAKAFVKEIEAEGFRKASGYYGQNDPMAKVGYSYFCFGADWQRNRVWHPVSEKAKLSNYVLLYDSEGGYMSPPSRWPFDDFDGFVAAMNKKHGANYTQWAYLNDIVPINTEGLL